MRFLPGVSKSERLALIEEALTGKCADPNYPRWYWSSPGAHACFEGDVDVLALLHRFGCNLEQKVRYRLPLNCNNAPLFLFSNRTGPSLCFALTLPPSSFHYTTATFLFTIDRTLL